MSNDLRDPDSILAEREAIALRNMYALLTIAEHGQDEGARVKASVELNKMLSIGISNRPTAPVRNVQVNRIAASETDDSTRRLLERISSSPTTTGIDYSISTEEEHLAEVENALLESEAEDC